MKYLLYGIFLFYSWIHPFELIASTLDTCTNVIGAFDNFPEYLCEDQSFTFLDPGKIVSYPNDTLIYVVTTDPDIQIAAAGSFIKMLNSKTVDFDASYMSYGTTYYIVALLGQKNGNGGIDFNAGCVQADGPKPFMFNQIPKPDAGLDDTICGSIYDLKGIQSVNGSWLKWKVLSGFGASFKDDESATTEANSNGQYGTYVFELTEDNNGCIASDTVRITFRPTPYISVIEKICILQNNITFPYVAKVMIKEGTPPYTILQGNGVIQGNIYTTDTLPSLILFTVQIQDANGCSSNLIIDDYNCNCGMTNAGRLDSSLTILCKDQCSTIKSIISETVDVDELTLYILHQSSWNDPLIPNVDTFYSINDIVCFDSTKMLTGLTYFITRVVGKRLLNTNQIDRSDPCLRTSNNQPVLWNDYADANAGRDFKQREFVARLNASDVQLGSGSWSMFSGPGQTMFEDIHNPKSRVRVNAYGNYCFAWSVDNKGCISVDTVCVEFYKTKLTTPETPKKAFEDRGDFYANENGIIEDVFIANPITESGMTSISILTKMNGVFNYTWLDIYGKMMLCNSGNIESGFQILNLDSPVKKGFYFLVLEINGIKMLRKISVI
jgi:hypothetical protein